MSFITETLIAVTLLPAIDIPDIEADFSPQPVQAGLQLVNQILALGVVGLLAVGIGIVILLATAGLDSRNKSKAWIALGVCAVAAMVMGSIVGFMTFFSNIPLF